MSLSTIGHAGHEDASVVAQVSGLVRELAALAGTGCLVEGPDGRLLGHHLEQHDVAAVVVQALVTGRLGPLHDALQDRRVAGRLPSGPVVEGRLGQDGPTVVQLALREGIGTAWLLVDGTCARLLELAAEPAERLRLLLAATWEGMEGSSLRAWLEGEPDAVLPDALRGASRLWLVATPDAAVVGRALRLTARACGSYLVVGTTAATTAAQVAAAVEAALPAGSSGLVVELVDPVAAAAALDAARGSAPHDRCVPLDDVRSEVVARRIAAALETLPDLGPDPLARLVAYDGRRGSALVPTLRAWLDGFGDAPSVAQLLGVHANTLRYRLGRIQEITGVDLRQDAAGRLELHLRLLGA